jgi:hypothetical protein
MTPIHAVQRKPETLRQIHHIQEADIF